MRMQAESATLWAARASVGGRAVPVGAGPEGVRAIVRHVRRTSLRDWASYLDASMRGAGLSQAELARRSGLAESMVSRWLRGMNQPDVPNLRRVRPVLGVPMLELLVAAGHLTPDEAALTDRPEPPVLGRRAVEVDLGGLTENQVRQVDEYAAFLRAQNAREYAEQQRTEQWDRDVQPGDQPLRYAAYGGARLTREQEERARDQARLARDRAERTGSRVVYLDVDRPAGSAAGDGPAAPLDADRE